MVDDQYRDLGRQALDDIGDEVGLARRHAGRRLVEQQHLRRQPERDGNFDKPLASIGAACGPGERILGEAERIEQCESFFGDGAVAPGRATRSPAAPSRSAIASVTFSSAERRRNSAVI